MTRPQELDQRGRRLRAALAAVLVRGVALELQLFHHWLDSWRGVGDVVVGMHRLGWDAQLIWMTCECGARIARCADDGHALDVNG